MTILANKLENLLVEKNVEMITWAVLENSCLEEVNNCLIAKHLFTVLLPPGLKVASETGHTWGLLVFFWRLLVQPVFGNLTRFIWPKLQVWPWPGLASGQKHKFGLNLPVVATQLSGLHPGEVSEDSRWIHVAWMEPTSWVPATNGCSGCGAGLELA